MKHKIIKLFFFLVVGTTPIAIGFLETVNAHDLRYKTINEESDNIKKEVNSRFNKPYSSLFPIIQESEKTANAFANRNTYQIEQKKIRLREIMIQRAKRKHLQVIPRSKYQYKQLNTTIKSNLSPIILSPYRIIKNKQNTSLMKIAIQAEKTADAFANKNPVSIKRNKEKLVRMMTQTIPKNKRAKTKIITTYRYKKPIFRKKNNQSSLDEIARIAENLADSYADGSKNVIAKRRRHLIATMKQHLK
jgi:hypothetical protein